MNAHIYTHLLCKICNMIRQAHLPQIHEAEPEKQHQGGQNQPAVNKLNKIQRHGNNITKGRIKVTFLR